MIPGPYYVYKCPNCGNLLVTGSLISGTTFGAKIFSDGKLDDMLPEFPDLTKCNKCDKIFWLSKLKEIGTYDIRYEYIKSDWENAENAEFLNIEDYFRALDEGLAENKQEELYIRQQIWWLYNDRVRSHRIEINGESMFFDETDELKYRENCNRLISLLDQSDLNQRIMIAELKRNLGDFEGCLEIIKNIDEDDLNWIKKIFINECKKRNKLVVELKK